MKDVQSCAAVCMGLVLLASCSSRDLRYSQWGDAPQMVDAGPSAVTAVGSEEVPLEIERMESTDSLLPEPVAYRGRRSVPASEVMANNKKKPAKDFQDWLRRGN
ncbi:MAG: hypothetical protein GXP30_05315 [Verrucomicrobia bacterium]|nr:hypothetical protein [Verrucomicrobiota bacterium]